MKNFKNKLTIVVCSSILLSILYGCEKDYFNTQPDNLLSRDEIFNNRENTERWWAGLFSNIPDMWTQPYSGYDYSITSDELDASHHTNPGVNSGAMGSFSVGSYYESIRLASVFLQLVDGNEEIRALDNGQKIIQHYKGEARFLRAYYYWLMMKNVGPVPIMPLEPLGPDGDFQIPRSTWDECVEFVLSEIELAKQNLPADYYLDGTTIVDGTKVGRINKIIATAVQSEILLYHASPLYNGNTEMADFQNLDGTQLISQTYDPNRWKRAADAAKKAIDLAVSNGKSLYRVKDPDSFRAAFLSVKNLFWDGWATEGIWLRPASSSWSWQTRTAPRSTAGNSWNYLAVVQELVDDFRMADGSSIEESTSYHEDTYTDTATPYYVEGTNSMYINRAPRFYAYVTFNGAVNPGRSAAGVHNSRVEFFNTGTSGKAGAPRDWPTTGYTARKNIHPSYSHVPAVNVSRPTMIIRLAELYLNYAEALNEAEPGHPDILKYLNKVRSRAGIPNLEPGLSQNELRKEIRLERRLELSFEGDRYFDVRRWKIPDLPESHQGGAFHGMNMDAGTYLSDPAFHQRTIRFTRALWERRFYFKPISQREIDRNHVLVQPPGY